MLPARASAPDLRHARGLARVAIGTQSFDGNG